MRLNEFGDPAAGLEEAPKPETQPSNTVNEFGDPVVGADRPRRPTATDNVVSAINDKPEEMAKAQELGHQLGMNPAIVSTDIPHFTDQANLQEAVNIIGSDTGIAKWVEDDPLNAKLAKNDFPQLKAAVDAVRNFVGPAAHQAYVMLKPFPEKGEDTFGEAILEGMREYGAHGWRARDVFSDDERKVLDNPYGPPGVVLVSSIRAARAALFAVSGGMRAAGEQMFGQSELAGIVGGEWVHLGGFGGVGHTYLPGATPKMPATPPIPPQVMLAARVQFIQNLIKGRKAPAVTPEPLALPKPWYPDARNIDSVDVTGFEDQWKSKYPNEASTEPYIPPVNQHALHQMELNEAPRLGDDYMSDQVHVAQHEFDRTSFEAALARAQETKLKSLSPTALEKLFRQETGDKNLYIPAETVAELYAGNEAHPKDGLLGWADNAPQKVATAVSQGTDMQVPVSQALAHMDPALYAKIKDVIRYRQGGITEEERKATKEREPASYSIETVHQDHQGLIEEDPWLFEPAPQVPWSATKSSIEKDEPTSFSDAMTGPPTDISAAMKLPRVPIEVPLRTVPPDVIHLPPPAAAPPTEAPPTAPEPPTTEPEVTPAPEVPLEDILPTIETRKFRPKTDPRIIDIVGPSRYENMGDFAFTAIKELEQNAKDAIGDLLELKRQKPGYKGKIEIFSDPISRTLAVQDNGLGMDAELLGGKFWDIAGSEKIAGDRSGGLGLSKALWAFNNKGIRVYTLHNGMFSSVKSDGAAVQASFRGTGPELEIDSRVATPEDVKMFPDGHGTRVEVDVPSDYQGAGGELTPIKMSTDIGRHPSIVRSPLIGRNIEVHFNGKQVPNVGTAFPMDEFRPFANVKAKWGVTRVIVSKKQREYGDNVHVLSNGIWQFSKRLQRSPNNYEAIPRTLYIDVSPSVKPTEPGYPFDINRQQFSVTSRQHFEKLFAWIQKLYQTVDLEKSAKDFGEISNLEEGPKGKIVETNKQKLEPEIERTPSKAAAIVEGDNVDFHDDGSIWVNGQKVPDLTEEDLKGAIIDYDKLKVAEGTVDPKKIALHDNLEVERPEIREAAKRRKEIYEELDANSKEQDKLKYGTPEYNALDKKRDALYEELKTLTEEDRLQKAINDVEDRLISGDRKAGETLEDLTRERDALKAKLKAAEEAPKKQSLVEAARSKFGEDRFNQYLHFLGQTFLDIRDLVADSLEYPEMKKMAVGLSFDQEYYGVNILLPFAGAFINPGTARFPENMRRAGVGMVGTMIHELAHHKVRSHNAEFPAEMQTIQIVLDEIELFGSDNTLLKISEAKKAVARHLEKNSDIFKWLTQQIESGSPTTRGRRFQVDAESRRVGGLPGDALAEGRDTGGKEVAKPPEEGRAVSDRPERGEAVARGGDEGGAISDVDDAWDGNERSCVETELTNAVRRERKALYLDPLFADAKSAGGDQVWFGRYSRHIAVTDHETYKKALAKQVSLAKKKLTPEWKKLVEQTRAEVETDLRSSPPIIAERYIRLGELPTGEIVPKQKLDEAAVAAYGGKGLERYTTKKGGIHPDDLALQLNFANGQQLVDSLNSFESGRVHSGRDGTNSPKEYFKKLVDDETKARMEREHGSLAEHVLDMARDLVTTQSHLERLKMEMQKLAELAGVPWDAKTLKDSVGDEFGTQIAKDVSYEGSRRDAAKFAKLAKKALLAGKYGEALKAELNEYKNVLMAKEAKSLEKKVATAERNFKRIMRYDKRTSYDQDYWDNARKALKDLGFSDKPIQAPRKSLLQLVNESQNQATVAPWLTGEEPKRDDMNYKNLTVNEFIALNNSIRSILNAGTQAKKIDSVHGMADLDNAAKSIAKQLERFKDQPPDEHKSYVRRYGAAPIHTIKAGLVLIERVMDYSDQLDPNGPITRFLDRPFRDSYKHELELTEQVVQRLRDLDEKYVDKSINDIIDNKVIMEGPRYPGRYIPMTRQNLRNIMLHLGSESGVKKITEGYKVDRHTIFNLVYDNATAADMHWVNGMHELFEFLWGHASEMERRYTGIEPEKIKPQPYEFTPKGSNQSIVVKGGYSPVFYDQTRSNIKGDLFMKNDLMDEHYIRAIPAHGWSIPRTDYVGWVDMNGTLMKSKIYQMVHDIAFREAVRNAQKLVSHPEFDMAFRRAWGDKYADLFKPWVKDIANIHSHDDQFAQGLARGLAVLRQAVTKTLINAKPGTIIKHALSTGLMSAAQRPTMIGGFVGLSKSASELGVSGLVSAMKQLAQSKKVILTPNERAALHQFLQPGTFDFMWNSSALMRNRFQQYPDTLRGAFERTTERGVVQSWRNLSAKNSQILGFALALGDFISSGTEWNMAYRDALMRTGDHDDSVFEADRAVSRAHGSSFYGDRPAVMRLGTGFLPEIGKNLTALYLVYNHMLANVMQWAWDIQARVSRGAGSEPGANWNSILQRTFIFGVGLMMVEIVAAPALNKDEEDSWGHRLLKAFVITFGGMFPGIREVTNGVMDNREPSAGMWGAAYHMVTAIFKDIDRAADDRETRDWIIHLFTIMGAAGAGSEQVGRTLQGVTRQMTGEERPMPNATMSEHRSLYRQGRIGPAAP